MRRLLTVPARGRRLRRYLAGRAGRALRRLHRNERGSIAVLSVFASLALLAAAGLAIDSGLAFAAQSRMSKALDSAGLAAGRTVLTGDITAEARAFFDANFDPRHFDATISKFSVTMDDDKEFITLEAEASIPTYLMKMFGEETVTFGARTVIHRETRGMELALVMDNTGSMRSGGKMDAMKQSARDLVNILYGDKDIVPDLWVSVVPYTATVNIGAHRTDWLADDDRVFADPSPFAPSTWKGCVEARPAPLDQDDTKPADAPFKSFLYKADVDNVWPPVDDTNGAQNAGTGPNLGCGPAITPLVAEKSTVIAAIDEMLPWHRGGTTGNLGLVWGWRTLSPKWRGLWGGTSPDTMPLDYHTPLMDKVVVMLTDGDNQFYDWPDHEPNKGAGPKGSDYTAYGRLNDFGFTKLDKARAEIDKRFTAICTAMKAEGIRLYTITFGSVPTSSTQTLYRNCATKPEFYFHAPTNDALSKAFDSIGEHLSNLYIVE